MKFVFLFLACAASLYAQRTAVMTSTTGQIVAPANFFTANALVTATSTRAPLMVNPAFPAITLSALTVSSLTVSPARWYAVFHIPAGEPKISMGVASQYRTATVSTGGTASFQVPLYTLQRTYWTDFELKGMQVQSGALSVKWKYFSFDANQRVYSQIWTVRPDIYFFAMAGNSRIARKQSAGYDSIYTQIDGVLGETGPGVSGWIVVVSEPASQTWFTPHNVNLYWAYRKTDGGDAENDAYGFELWRPIAPLWTTQAPNLSSLF